MVKIRAALFVVIASSSVAACIPALSKPKPPPAPPRDYQAERDAQKIERMEKLRAKAMAAPGSASEAGDFAFALAGLHSDGVAARRNLAPTLVDDAAKCLDQARDARPEEAHQMLGRKGQLLIEAGRRDDGFRALNESMDARPNLRAFELLGKLYKQQNQDRRRGKAVQAHPATMRTDIQRYDILHKCVAFSGASTIEGGLRWASAKDVEFYRQAQAEVADANARHQEQQRIEQKEEWQKQDRERIARAAKRKAVSGSARRCIRCARPAAGARTGCMGRCQSDAWSCKSSCR